MKSQKTLYILRHAKAEVGLPTGDDHDRALAVRGVQDAAAMGQRLALDGVRPGLVLCSTALRARQTLEQLQKAYKEKLAVEFTPGLYMASAKGILALIAKMPEEVSSLLIVGHNPGFHELSLLLAKAGDEDLLEDIRLKFPTCAFAALELAGPWEDVAHAQGELLQFIAPGEL